MTNTTTLAHQLTQARNELNNLRKTMRGLQADHRKDVCQLKEMIAKTHTRSPTPLAPHTPQQPASAPSPGLLHDWEAIGHIKSWFRTKNGTPRQGSVSSLTRGVLRLAPHTFTNPHHALQGLHQFSHVWLLFVFDKNEVGGGRGHRRSKVAPPRLGGQRVGVLGTRSPHRPNPLGLTLARLDKVDGDCLHLSGLDILDGTPVLDIKPYILQYDAPPAIASQFTANPTAPNPANLDEEDANSSPHGNSTASEKYTQENQDHARLKPQIETQRIMSSLTTNPTPSVPTRINEENANSSPPGNSAASGKYTQENQDHARLKPQIETERIMSSERESDVVSLSDPALEKHSSRQGKLTEKPPMETERIICSEDDDILSHEALDNISILQGKLNEIPKRDQNSRTEEEVNVGKPQKHNLSSEEKNTRKETHVPDDLRDLSEYKESKQRSIDPDRVVMAPWISTPPIDPLHVVFNPIAQQQLLAFTHQAEDDKYRLEYLSDGEELKEAITSVLQQDPRSVYRRSKCPSLLYYFSVDSAHITAWFEESCAEVLRIQPLSTQH